MSFEVFTQENFSLIFHMQQLTGSGLIKDNSYSAPNVPRISVLIACYNVGKWIRACVDSILAQNGPFELEIIAVDDCSTDDTIDVLSGYHDRRIKIIRHDYNMGLSATRNSGLDSLSGDWFFLIDGDDYLPEGALASMLPHVESDVDWVQGGYSVVDENGAEIEKRAYPYGEYRSHQQIAENLEKIEFVTAHNRLTNARLKNAHYKVGKAPHEDLMWNLTVFPQLTKIIQLSCTTYCYVQRAQSISHKTRASRKWVDELIDIIPLVYNCVSSGLPYINFNRSITNIEIILYTSSHPDINAKYRKLVRETLMPYFPLVGNLSYLPWYLRTLHAAFAGPLPEVFIYVPCILTRIIRKVLRSLKRIIAPY